MSDGKIFTENEQVDTSPIDKDLELAGAIAIAFSPFNINAEDLDFIVTKGLDLSNTMSLNLLEWCKREREELDIVGMAAAYVAVHTLFSRYNSWLHEELAELQRIKIENEEHTDENVHTG